jgi:NAD(P)-dependent dehydrogenase (short-subunit alcohol dehydrogenase family)
MSKLGGKVALITGAGRGVGRRLALALAECGASVAANDLLPGSVDETVELIQAGRGTARVFLADVARKMPVQAMIEQVRTEYGRIDILINHAAVRPRARLVDMDEWDWDRTIDVNLKGPFLTMQSVGRVMEDQGGGVMVNIGRSEAQDRRESAFAASMEGLSGLSLAAADELAASRIRLHLIRPGPCPAGSGDLPEQIDVLQDVIGLTVFLCSDEAGDIAGRLFWVPDGWG